MREEVGREERWADAEAPNGWMNCGVGDSGSITMQRGGRESGWEVRLAARWAEVGAESGRGEEGQYGAGTGMGGGGVGESWQRKRGRSVWCGLMMRIGFGGG
jgi:hypothetical protein